MMVASTTHGGARPGAGRPKGALNRRTRDLAERLVDAGRCPVEALVRIAEDAEKSGNAGLALDAWKAVLPYVHARPKPYESEPDARIALERELAEVRRANVAADSNYGQLLRAACAKAGLEPGDC